MADVICTHDTGMNTMAAVASKTYNDVEVVRTTFLNLRRSAYIQRPVVGRHEVSGKHAVTCQLRATIWSLSIRQEHVSKHYGDRCHFDRRIEFHNHDPATDSISVTLSRPYPTLFAVCREARYEAAKLMGCTWVPVNGRYNSPTEPAHITQFEICINFKLDTINLRTRFLTPPPQGSLTVRPNPQQYRLDTLARLLDSDTLQRIERIVINAQPPASQHRLEIDAWWKGEGLEIFCPGRLKRVIVITRGDSDRASRDYSHWLEVAVRDGVHDRWTERGETNEPKVEMLNAWREMVLTQV
ncbi:hypothetical protein BU25DRAFT_416679 [Macroventuria anomochaeta]|uniref:Uncharacterized protein n=1 Tax=Macroventuria anomochaeta TaxID=301207 RepID=A0ACB6SJ74_9PLEO|nr:uncharacterized protein BU25DRAFT_416679 [Macroventuria anomochaeta]KAF2633474.1 hypothetical protein BU25DRAFT_416679 [Macroventuria anomochaeta]